MIRTTALLATLLLASPALSNPVPMPTRMPAGPVSLDAFKGWVAVPVAVMINGQITTQWMLVPAQAVAGVAAATPAPAVEAGAPAAPAADPAATHGRVIAATCASCHGTHGISHGAIPGLAGLEKAYFIKQMKSFQDGSRPATVMHQHAKAYSDDEIEQMAAIFAAVKP